MSAAKLYKYFNRAIKIIVFVLAYYFIHKQLTERGGDFNAVLMMFREESVPLYFIAAIVLVFLLMLVNWGVESLKWQKLIEKNEKISWRTSITGVFGGVTISSITPNRTGEYLGRVFILKKTHPVRGIFITMIGSISQLFATLLAGTLAIAYVIVKFPVNVLSWPHMYVIAAAGAAGVLTLVFAAFYFNIPGLYGKVEKWIQRRPSVHRFLNVFRKYNRKDLFKIWGWSMLRYAVFSFQLYILLRILQVNFPFADMMAIIALIFMGITLIPSVALAELPVRGSVAITVLTIYEQLSSVSICEGVHIKMLAATSILWLINIVLPAIIGSFVISKMSFFDTKKVKMHPKNGHE